MKNLGIQEYLSLGYLYLLIIGLITDTIFYHMIGINIMNYSAFLDILITPINLMTNNIILPIAVGIIVILFLLWKKYILPKHRKDKPALTTENLVTFFAAIILFLFLGLGIGMGTGVKKRMESGKLKANHEITFNDARKLRVRVIGQNSQYLFYVPEGEKNVVVSPIGNTVFQLRKIDN